MNTGTMLGPFKIGAALGAGGMGEVYRAHDLRLHREVALKILPQSFAVDAGRRARFEREARVLASLNHPNIATLYGVEDTAAGPVLVMELVDGITLADRLALAGRGVSDLPLRETLSIAQQLAAALEAAHTHGVVHRDLKPANIAVRPDGTVKVLDFGLAKTVDGEAAAVAGQTAAVTLSDAATVIGPGTPAYMSPEQVRGIRADTRTDIWAFGCVLYELLTRQRAFDGDRPSDVAARILEREPDFAALPPDTPPPIRRLLQRCLAKDSQDRLRDIGDARLELRDALVSQAAPVPSTRWPGSRATAALALSAVAVLAGLAGWSAAIRWTPRASSGVIRLSIPSMEPPVGTPFGVRHVAVSADGSRFAYASAGGLWIRRMDARDTITVDEPGSDPFFSPDDESLGFFADGPALLKKMPVRGGPPITIATVHGRPSGATWGTDGTIVFATTEGLFQVSDNGGEPTLLIKPDRARKERAYASPCFLPGDDVVLFTIIPDGPIEGAQIAALDLKTRTATLVLRGASAARYAPTGHLVYASGQTLNAIAFDRATLRTRGEGAAVRDVQITTAVDNGAADFAISDAGTLVFITANAPGLTPSALWWVDRHGHEEPLPLPPDLYYYARISPDGSRLALDITGANRDIWVFNSKRPGLTRLTSSPGEDMLPVWSRSGRVFFASQRNGNFDIFSRASDGATPERVEYSGGGDQMPLGFTPDGTALIVNENFKDVGIARLGPPATLTPLLHSDAHEWIADVSPDGRWIAYESDETGDRTEIFVRPFTDVTASREKVSIDGGRYPMWSPTGTGDLFYVDPNGAMMAASITLSPSLVVNGVTKLFDTRKPTRGTSGRPYDVSPVDGRFLVARPVSAAANRTIDINVVVNWFDELRLLVPDR